MEKITASLDSKNLPNSITFYISPEKWVFKINMDGIFFNRQEFKEKNPDDFALDVIEILERNFDVEFKKKPDR